LKHLDEYIAARRKAADFYDRAFANNKRIKVPFRAGYSHHVFHQYTLVIDGPEDPVKYRDGLNRFLADNKIPSMIYYPVPGHKQKMFDNVSVVSRPMPVTDWLTQRVISLPMHTELDEEQLKFITDKVTEYTSG
jgi:UDP-2-acetamido-2-deoxy-ribo-hexuluronate aminotransferase